jgi:hypothetical protein
VRVRWRVQWRSMWKCVCGDSAPHEDPAGMHSGPNAVTATMPGNMPPLAHGPVRPRGFQLGDLGRHGPRRLPVVAAKPARRDAITFNAPSAAETILPAAF